MTHLTTNVKQSLIDAIKAIKAGNRCYVLQRTKRVYSPGDTLILEGDEQIELTVTDVETDPGVKEGWVIVSFTQK